MQSCVRFLIVLAVITAFICTTYSVPIENKINQKIKNPRRAIESSQYLAKREHDAIDINSSAKSGSAPIMMAITTTETPKKIKSAHQLLDGIVFLKKQNSKARKEAAKAAKAAAKAAKASKAAAKAAKATATATHDS
ncbi:uncharacterized protein BX663DRAFT_585737 [Cokeromyces recurvatus]|uniref:uncharacterized protein n=1 Tax=Cokeromyces recurvatus TaxID=90255 RepID=UPI00221EBA02|nr:uncharacterized protein BX663DRAFT_585737 [Cokeromyces recurvatus]KAI7905287.1 hypothetical protein BX663DRAFT_585737 [Cokeromyces recurvatus]